MTNEKLATELSEKREPMKILESDGVRYFYFEKMKELGLNHLYSSIDVDLTIGGRSTDPALHKDWNRFIQLMPDEHTEYYFMHQKHTDFSVPVEEEGMGEELGLGRRIPEPDGLVTSRADFMLSSSFADCAPLLMFDPVRRVQANVHSGWRGTLANIGGNTIQLLIDTYEVNPENLHIAVGPHIGFEDFEVDQDVAEMFSEKYPELEGLVKRKGETPEELKRNKYLVDLHLCLVYNFVRLGVPAENIISTNLSTMSHPEYFHSFRRDKDKFGLMMVLSQMSR